MNLTDVIIIVINIFILAIFEAVVLGIAWFFGAITGAAINYNIVGAVVFVIWALYAIVYALAYVKTRLDKDGEK